ncbi:FRG domain-containing protein [Maribacter sp. 2308TA10-17]|uniref:FRG domain-containing protein n=1 Tax=Maribacter sp. 2308TA10-17 TaxID=3386276 RepID=UPI0039BCBDDB
MEKIEIKSVSEYLEKVNSFEQQHIAQWVFRGHSDEAYELVPSLFRIDIENTLTDWDDLEEYMLKVFQREARPFNEYQPADEIELISLAQHHGLPTRLLDWSTNPLVALFFAVEQYQSEIENSAVWCYGFHSTHNCFPESTRIDRRLTLEKENNIIFPNHVSPRITNQSGCFTAHELPTGRGDFVPFDQQPNHFGVFDLFVINKKYRKDILDQLYDLGYHHGLIYPGLDGLSKRIRYEASTTHKRCSNVRQRKKFMNQ